MIDLETIMEQLQPGELYEIPVVYVGRDYLLPVRAVMYRLTPDQETQRRKDRAYKEKKKNITFSDRTKNYKASMYTLRIFHWNMFLKKLSMSSTLFVGK
jgi:hypothetical protein